ncbi:response regulator [Dyadobacter tibetensis]|uniref:response regulator n=1 Tax=Dyadobacter tibetensis TaxID=1211851 RepID=UPI000472C044|nr:response regulator [Dyadobacter tibetensis]
MKEEITCLLIDDDYDDHEIFSMAISDTQLDVKCVTAYNWEEAELYLSQEGSHVPDFIFIDWNLTDMYGWECLVRLRQFPKLSNTQFVIQSGVVPQEMNRYAEKYQCKFIQKSGSIAYFSSGLKSILTQVG